MLGFTYPAGPRAPELSIPVPREATRETQRALWRIGSLAAIAISGFSLLLLSAALVKARRTLRCLDAFIQETKLDLYSEWELSVFFEELGRELAEKTRHEELGLEPLDAPYWSIPGYLESL